MFINTQDLRFVQERLEKFQHEADQNRILLPKGEQKTGILWRQARGIMRAKLIRTRMMKREPPCMTVECSP